MLTKFVVLGAALIVTVPVLAASGGGGSAGSSTTATASGGHAGSSGGGSSGGGNTAGGGGGHSAGLGAHAAAMTTHLGGPLQGATAHNVTGHTPQSQRVAIADKTSKKPDHDHDHASHRFLHRTAYNNPLDWTQLCLSSYSATDGRWWPDCNRPAKSSSKPHS
jgi:hypothetical protein